MESEELEIEQVIPIKKLVFNEPDSCFVCLRKETDAFPSGSPFFEGYTYFEFFIIRPFLPLISYNSYHCEHLEIFGEGL